MLASTLLSMSGERSSVRQGVEEPEGTHLATTDKPKQMLKEVKSQREALDKMDGAIWDGLQGAKDESDSLRARLEQVESQVTQLLERIKGEIRAEAPDATSAADTRAQEWFFALDERVTVLVRQLYEKVLAFLKQLAEAVKQLKAREDDCDSLRAALSRLQARTGQLEARLKTEIEQLNHELAGLEEAVSAMRTVESRCIENLSRLLKGHQSRMDAEFVRRSAT